MRRPKSLRAKVTIVATLVVAVPLILAATSGAISLRNDAMRPDLAPVKLTHLCVQTDGVQTGGADSGLQHHPNSLCQPGFIAVTGPPRSNEVVAVSPPRPEMVAFATASFHSVSLVPNVSLWPFTDPESTGFTYVYNTGERFPSTTSVGNKPVEPAELSRIADVQRTLNHQLLSLSTGTLLLIALVAVVMWIATGRVLRPVEAIRRHAAAITEHDLTRRVPVPTGDNEITRLATTINATLDRLHSSVENNRRFAADASHELRSPLATLRAELEIAQAHPELVRWQDVLHNAINDTHRLQELATDLLLLTHLDANTPPRTDTVDLTQLVHDETTRHHTSRLTVTTELGNHPVLVQGSRTLLTRMLVNLLDNAERHATSTITVRLTSTAESAILDVIDDGPGIPREDHERVFGRFTRLDDTRTRDTGGTGLGLAIARRIATVHGGTLHLADHRQGARFTATLPRTSNKEVT